MKQDFYEQIERYLLNKMSPSERAAFEEELCRNPELAEQFALQKREHEAMDILVQERLRAQLRRWSVEHPLREIAPWYHHRMVLAAATLLLLLAALYLAWPLAEQDREIARADNASDRDSTPSLTVKKEQSPSETIAVSPTASSGNERYRQIRAIARKYKYETFSIPTPSVLRGEEEEESTCWAVDSALVALEKRQYTRGIQLLKQVPEEEMKCFVEARHLIGKAYYLKGKYKEARSYLEQASNISDYWDKCEAEWELAICYLSSNEILRALRLLESMAPDKGHCRHKEARQLLKDLKPLL